MRIKIIEPGWETYTGNFGGVEFNDGVSTREVTDVEAMRISNIVRTVNEEGISPSSSQLVLDSYSMKMEVKADSAQSTIATEIVATEVKRYTKEELTAIADKSGIEGLRKLKEADGMKSRSINGLIDMILRAQEQLEVDGQSKGELEVLIGSSLQPSQFVIDSKPIPLGDVVRAAFERSGMTVSQWNTQDAKFREESIANEVKYLHGV